ncbi:MAG: adenylate/guanylate cyclase domain-containing protein [Deltaproteobacteria bacterium]|nr:adenylate/guanylate cyclase domain-containing protein [Deltaproteobacteria bacterium]
MSTKKPPAPPQRPQSASTPRAAERVQGLDALFEPTSDRAAVTSGHALPARPAGLLDLASEPTDDLAAAAMAVRALTGETPAYKPEPPSVEYRTAEGAPHTKILLDTTTVGRHTENDIQLLDPEVSKAHLVIRKAKDGFVLEDLGSANGTLVNGQKLSRHVLQDGDLIAVGNSTLRIRMERPRAPKATVRPSMKAQPIDDPVSSSQPQPLNSFAEMRRSDPIFEPGEPSSSKLKSSGEHTSVTLIPEHLLSEPNGDSVFAEQPAEINFDKADEVLDDRALRRDYERLRVAFDLFANVGLETDLEALGKTILSKIRGLLPSDTAVIMLRDPGISDDLVTLASYSERNTAVQIPRAIVERVLLTKGGLLTSDAQIDQQLRRSETIVGARIRSALCVPLVVRGEVLGVIHLSSTSLAGAYEEKDLSLLRAIAQPAALAVANARLRRKIEEEAAMRAELSRFLSPALVEKALRNELDVSKAGDKVQCTVLFSDIRGFTTISDGAAPEQVVSMLNEYFDAMVEVVFEHGGTLDKFIGDGLMAVWGTPVQADDDAVRCVRAAQRMRMALEDIVNSARTSRGEAPLHVGFGIATGRVVAGAMGARRRLDFTVIGDTVNLASRLCGQAKPGQVLVDETTERIIKKAGVLAIALEPRMVKGFAKPVAVFDVDANPQTDPIGDRFLDKTPAGA